MQNTVYNIQVDKETYEQMEGMATSVDRSELAGIYPSVSTRSDNMSFQKRVIPEKEKRVIQNKLVNIILLSVYSCAPIIIGFFFFESSYNLYNPSYLPLIVFTMITFLFVLALSVSKLRSTLYGLNINAGYYMTMYLLLVVPVLQFVFQTAENLHISTSFTTTAIIGSILSTLISYFTISNQNISDQKKAVIFLAIIIFCFIYVLFNIFN